MLLDELKRDFPELVFRDGKKFMFKPPKTVFFTTDEANFEMLILHEVAHAMLKHFDFKTNLERVRMENEAWEKAKELASRYSVVMDEDLIQNELDTYRDWLHKKSRCPKCGLTRFQTPDAKYHCPRCENLT